MNNIVNLSICADDFGITENVSSAIVKLIKKKRITETSCIAISDSFKNDSKTLINFKLWGVLKDLRWVLRGGKFSKTF